MSLANLSGYHDAFVKWLTPTSSADSDAIGRRRISLLVLVVYEWILITPPFVAFYFVFCDSWEPGIALLLAMTLSAAVIPLVKIGALSLARIWSVFNILWVIVVLSAFTGGLTAPAVLWLIVVPLVAGVVAGPKAEVIWGTVVVITFLGFVIVETISPDHFPDLLDPQAHTVLLTVSIIGIVAVLFRAIAQKKSSLDLLADQVRDQHDELHAILVSAPDAVFAVARDGRVERCSEVCATVFGRATDEILGASIFTLVPTLDVGSLTAVRAESGVVEDHDGRRSDGTRLSLAVSVEPYGTPPHQRYVVIARDVTRERELENQLRQSHKMEAIGRLAGGIAHDFNNLLSIVSGHAEFLAPGVAHDPRAREDLRVIRDSADRGAALVKQLLAFSRGGEERPTFVELSVAVEHISSMLLRTLGARIDVTVVTTPEPCAAFIHPNRFEQIIYGMAVNARDAMPDGGELTLRTVVRDRVTDGVTTRWAVVEIADTGCGMDAATTEKVFEPFFTTSEIGQRDGLGLATAHGTVRGAGGRIEVRSELGIGTTFTILLPLAELPAQRPDRANCRE